MLVEYILNHQCRQREDIDEMKLSSSNRELAGYEKSPKWSTVANPHKKFIENMNNAGKTWTESKKIEDRNALKDTQNKQI